MSGVHTIENDWAIT